MSRVSREEKGCLILELLMCSNDVVAPVRIRNRPKCQWKRVLSSTEVNNSVSVETFLNKFHVIQRSDVFKYHSQKPTIPT